MSRIDRMQDEDGSGAFTGRLLLLVFGLGVLAFLVAIDRPDWFAIRPATGTSIALAKAADNAPIADSKVSSTANP